jgi:glycosyltransferase involved in cell wall biosynthesis
MEDNKCNYSIIIPHKNIPKLLQRCLDSIPQRADLEVIVVDDNSDSDVVDFDNFPGKDRKNTSLFFDKSGKGAGRARNIGLQHAHGKWLLFADADDYFNYCINDILNEYRDGESDIVFFSASSVDCDSYNNVSRADAVSEMIENYLQGGPDSELMLRYCLACPWGKLVKRKLVAENNISFQETTRCNDVKFSYLIGHYSKNIHVDKRALYCLTYRGTSISNSLEECRVLDEVNVEAERDIFLKKEHVDLPEGCYHYYIGTLRKLKKEGDLDLFEKCVSLLSEYGVSKNELEDYFKGYNQKTIGFWANLRNRLAIRTRVHRFFTLD